MKTIISSLFLLILVFSFFLISARSALAVTFTRKVFLQNATPTSMEFRWVTDTHEALIVKYGTSTSYGSQVNADTVTGTGSPINHAKISGLSANTTYYYQVTSQGGAALTPAGDSSYHFKTPPNAGASTPFSFAIWGDSGVGGGAQDSVSNQVTAKNPDLVFIAGDIAYPYSADFNNNNTKYFNHYGNSMRFAPYYVTCGNHETSCPTVMADHTLPNGGSTAGISTYSFDYGNFHFVALNSEISHGLSDAQITWAANDIRAAKARNPKPWVLVFWHQNFWSAGSHSTQSGFEPMVRMSHDAGADFVAWGHSHAYERWPTNVSPYTGLQVFTIGDGGQTGSSGCANITPKCVAGSGQTSPTTGLKLSTAGFLWFQVNGNTVTANYVGSGGATEDKVTYTLGGGPTNPPGTNTPTTRPTNTPTRPPNATNTPTPRPTSTSTPRPTGPTPNCSTNGIPGDANNDQKVDGIDFVAWLNHYNQSVSCPNNGDFNSSGFVDGVDYTIWLTNYGRGSPTAGGTRTPTPTRPPNATSTPTRAVTPTRTGTSTPIPTGGGGTGGAPYHFGAFDPNMSLIELQGWWGPISEDGLNDNGLGFGHIHILCKWPAGRNVTGNINTNCRLTMHNNPSKMDVLRFDLAPGNTKASISLSNLPAGSPQSAQASCFYNDGLGSGATNCSWNVPVNLDTGSWPTGWDHLRLRYTIQTVDGKRWTTSSEIPFQIRGGSGVTDGGFSSCLHDCFVAKSWYDGFDYQRTRIVGVPFDHTISGTHTFYVQAWKGSSPKTQRLLAVVDRSHFIPAVGPWPQEDASLGPPPGSVTPAILDVANPNPSTLYPLVVDTTKLANGWHSVASRTIEANAGHSTCSYCSSESNFQVAVAKFYFYVQN